MSRTISATLKADIRYALSQDSGGVVLKDSGKIDYELDFTQGSGNGQIQNIWWAEITNTGGLNNLDLTALPFDRLGTSFDFNFTSTNKVSAVEIYNRSSAPLYFQFPYYDTSDFCMVPASGYSAFASSQGWMITGGDVIGVSGTGTQDYRITLLG